MTGSKKRRNPQIDDADREILATKFAYLPRASSGWSSRMLSGKIEELAWSKRMMQLVCARVMGSYFVDVTSVVI